jgi:hypothetical protein
LKTPSKLFELLGVVAFSHTNVPIISFIARLRSKKSFRGEQQL